MRPSARCSRPSRSASRASTARHLQRQDVRRAGDGDALALPPHGAAARRRSRTSTCCIRRVGCGSARVGTARSDDGGMPAVDARADAVRRAPRRRRARHARFRGAFSSFLRSGDPRPLEPVLEHNRLDLVSLAAVTARAVQLVEEGSARCRDAAEALALGKVYERAGDVDRGRASCYRRAAADQAARRRRRKRCTGSACACRRERRFAEAAAIWRELLDVESRAAVRRSRAAPALRQFAVEALAIHHEHRERDYEGRDTAALAAATMSRWRTIAGRRRRRRRRRDGRAAAPAGASREKDRQRNDSHLFGRLSS